MTEWVRGTSGSTWWLQIKLFLRFLGQGSRGTSHSPATQQRQQQVKFKSRARPMNSLNGPLWDAARAGNGSAIRSLLEEGVDVNCRDLEGRTALPIACYEGHIDVATLLLDCGANINNVDSRGMTALTVACMNGKLEIARLLLERGHDVHQKNNKGDSALHWACKLGYTELALLLVYKGADMGMRNYLNKSPLDLAASEEMRGAMLNLKDQMRGIVKDPPVKKKGKEPYMYIIP